MAIIYGKFSKKKKDSNDQPRMSEYPISRPSQIFPGLKPLVACHGVSVTTVEGVGSERKCVHQVQKRIAPLALWDERFLRLGSSILGPKKHPESTGPWP